MSDDYLIYTPPDSPYARAAGGGRTPSFIDSPVRRALTQDIVRFAKGELNGRSYLIAGHRGAGKTTLSLLATQLAEQQLQSEEQPSRPLIVPLHGPSLLGSTEPPPKHPQESRDGVQHKPGQGSAADAAAASKVDANAQAAPESTPKPDGTSEQLTRVLARITTELYHAVAAEFVKRMHEVVAQADRVTLMSAVLNAVSDSDRETLAKIIIERVEDGLSPEELALPEHKQRVARRREAAALHRESEATIRESITPDRLGRPVLSTDRPASEPSPVSTTKNELQAHLRVVLAQTKTQRRMKPLLNDSDRTELAEQLRIDLHGVPRLSRLRDLFRRARVLEDGVLFRTASGEMRGTRELAALWSASRAYMRVAGKLTSEHSETKGQKTERTSGSSDPTATKDFHPLFASALALLTGLGLTAAEYPLVGVGAGLLTGLVSLLALDARTSRKMELLEEASETFEPDTTAHSLVRLLPRLVHELRDIGLAPIFVVDELDKVDDLNHKLTGLVELLKSVVADETFFCFLTDRDYFAEQQHQGRDGAYSRAHTLFAQSEYIVYSPVEMRRFVSEVVKPPPVASEKENAAREAAALFAYSTVLRVYGHAIDLRRELARVTGGTDRVLTTVTELRSDRRRHLEATVAMAMEHVLLRPDIRSQLTDAHLTQVLIDTLYLPVRSWLSGDGWFFTAPDDIRAELHRRADTTSWEVTDAHLEFVGRALTYFRDELANVDGLQARLGIAADAGGTSTMAAQALDARSAQLNAVAAIDSLKRLVPERLTNQSPPQYSLVEPGHEDVWPAHTWLWTVHPNGEPVDPARAAERYRRHIGAGAGTEHQAGAPTSQGAAANVEATNLAAAAPQEEARSESEPTLPTPTSPTHFVRVIGAADNPDAAVLTWATTLGTELAKAGYGLLTSGVGRSDDAVRGAYLAARGARPWQILTTDVGHHRPKPLVPDEVIIPYEDLPRADTAEARELLGDAIILLQAGKMAERYVELARTSGVPVLPVPTAGALPATVHQDGRTRRAGPALDEQAWQRLAEATPEDPAHILQALATVLRAGPFRPVAEPLEEVLTGLRAFDEAIRRLTDEQVQPTDLAERYGLLPAQPRWWDVRDAAERLAPQHSEAPQRPEGDEALVRAWWNEVRQHADAISTALGAAKALADVKQDGEPGAVKRALDRLAQRWPPEAPGRYLGVQRTYHAWRLLEHPLDLKRPGGEALEQLCQGNLPVSNPPKSREAHSDEAWTRWRSRLFSQVERGDPIAPDVHDAIEHALDLPTAELPLRLEDASGWSRVLFRCPPFGHKRPLPPWLRPIALHHLGLGFAALPDAISQHAELQRTTKPATLGSLRDQLRRLTEHLERVPPPETVILLFLAADLRPPPTFTRQRHPIVVAEARMLGELERLLDKPPALPKLRPFYALGADSPVPTGITFAGAAPAVLRFQPGTHVLPEQLAWKVKLDP